MRTLLLAQISPATVEAAARHIEDHTNTYLVIFAAVGPLLALGAAALFVVKYVMPIWKEEQAANRAQRADEAEKTRQHLSEDRENARAFADEQHKRLVDSITGRVDRLNEKVDDVSRRTGQIATKLGLSAVLLLLCGCAMLQRAAPGLIDCAAPPVSTLTADVLGRVGGALRGQGFSGYSVLDQLLAQLGPAVVCAAAKIANEGGAQPQSGGVGHPDPERQLMADRAAAWLRLRHQAVRLGP